MISFFKTMVFSLVAAHAETFVFLEGLRNFRNRMLTVATEPEAFTTEDSIIGCRPALCKRSPPLRLVKIYFPVTQCSTL